MGKDGLSRWERFGNQPLLIDLFLARGRPIFLPHGRFERVGLPWGVLYALRVVLWFEWMTLTNFYFLSEYDADFRFVHRGLKNYSSSACLLNET